MTNQLLTKGNITTIATWIAIAISAIIAYFGIEFDFTPFIPVIAFIITLIIAVYSSKHPNTFGFLGNDEETIDLNVDGELLAQTIQELIDKYNANSTIDVEVDEVVDDDGGI